MDDPPLPRSSASDWSDYSGNPQTLMFPCRSVTRSAHRELGDGSAGGSEEAGYDREIELSTDGSTITGLDNLAFDVSGAVPPDSWYATLLRGTVNFTPATTWLQAIAWLLYIVPVFVLFLRPAPRSGRRRRPPPRPARTSGARRSPSRSSSRRPASCCWRCSAGS